MNGTSGFLSWPLWVVALVGGGVAAHLLLKKSSEEKLTEEATPAPATTEEMPSKTPPAGYTCVRDVARRIGELKTLYAAKQLSAEETIAQLDAIAAVVPTTPGSPDDRELLMSMIAQFEGEIQGTTTAAA